MFQYGFENWIHNVFVNWIFYTKFWNFKLLYYIWKEVKVSVLANSKVSVLLDLFLFRILPSQREKVLQKHPSRSVLRKRCSENLQSNFIEITLRHGCSPVKLLYISKTPFPKSTSDRLILVLQFNYFTVRNIFHIQILIIPFFSFSQEKHSFTLLFYIKIMFFLCFLF